MTYISKLPHFLDALNHFAVALSAKGNIRFFNAHAERSLGYRAREIKGMPWKSLLSSDDKKIYAKQSLLTKVIPAAPASQQLVKCRHKKGHLVALSITTSDLQINGEQYTLVLGQEMSWVDAREKQLRELAELDPLTNIDNRLGLERFIERCTANTLPFALFYMDLDHFKAINDQHGHQTGDLVLQQCASRIRHQLRKDDGVARIGGDEFVAVCPRLSERTNAEKVAAGIRNAIQKTISLQGNYLQVDISIGIVVVPPSPKVDRQTLMSIADHTMYCAKRKRTHLEFFDGDIPDSAIRFH